MSSCLCLCLSLLCCSLCTHRSKQQGARGLEPPRFGRIPRRRSLRRRQGNGRAALGYKCQRSQENLCTSNINPFVCTKWGLGLTVDVFPRCSKKIAKQTILAVFFSAPPHCYLTAVMFFLVLVPFSPPRSAARRPAAVALHRVGAARESARGSARVRVRAAAAARRAVDG